MRPAELVRALACQGMELLEDLASDALSRADLGQSDSVAVSWERAATVYFGPARSRRLQAAAVKAGRGLPVAAIEKIEKHVRRLSRKAAVSAWELRVELCALRGTVDEIDREAAARVLAHNRRVADGDNRGLRSLRGGKNTDAQGMRTMTARLPERDMARMMSYLDASASGLREKNPHLALDQARADALLSHVTGALPGHVPPPPVPMVIIPKDKYVEVVRHEGDETVFGLTDGTTITGRELVAEGMSEEGYFGIFCPIEGGVNAYRKARFATAKQRMLLAAETLVCPYPECTTAADQCQVHHIAAWKHGGETNMDNLTVACRKHNGRNDDDPHAPPRNGRLERQPGGVVHRPPDGGPPRINRHPVRGLSAMALVTT